MADKTMWRGQSATLTIGTIQDLTAKHISSYTLEVINGSTSANGSFSGVGDSTDNGRAISTSAHVASGNTTGYTDYTVKGYLKYTHNAYGVETKATSNTVTKSLRVQEPLDQQSLKGFSIEPTEIWSNFSGVQNITIKPGQFAYTPYSKKAEITCSQKSTILGGGSNGATSLELNGTSSVQYQNDNTTKDLGTQSKNIEFYAYSIAGTSAATKEFLYSRSLKVKNAVTALSISESLNAYNNAGLWDPNESVIYTPTIPYSTEVSLVHETTDDAYSGNTISQNGISVTLNPSTGDFVFDVSNATNASVTSTFKFRVKSIQGQNPVYSNVMTFTAHGYTPSYTKEIWEGETITIANLGIGTFTIPSGLQNVTVKKTGDGLGITIKGKAVSTNTTEDFIIESNKGSRVTIKCIVKNIQDISRSINTGDTITITGQEIKAATAGISVTSISAITTGPSQGKGTAYVSAGKLIYYAPGTAQEDVPITVTTDTGASAVIHMKVKAITMTIS